MYNYIYKNIIFNNFSKMNIFKKCIIYSSNTLGIADFWNFTFIKTKNLFFNLKNCLRIYEFYEKMIC